MAKIRSEIRKSYIFDKYAIITPGRAKRPRDVREEEVNAHNPSCPFCFNNVKKGKIVHSLGNKDGKWQTAVVKNLYPAVSLNNERAKGTQEVVIETPDHGKNLSDLSLKEITLVIKTFIDRTKTLSKAKGLDYILCFKNQGAKSGASITHAHSQIFATEIVPENLKDEAAIVAEYRAEKKSCAYCDILKKELKSSRRIFEDRNVGAFAPYASEYHYEAWIFPKRHLDNITLLKEVEIVSLAKALMTILKKLDSIGLSYNFFLHNVISDPNQHFYVKVQPREAVFGGIELGSGLVINSVPPEAAARFYRK